MGMKFFIYFFIDQDTLECLSIGTPKTINFPFVANGKLMVFRCPNIQAHYHEPVLYLIFGKFIILGVPILKHIRECTNFSFAQNLVLPLMFRKKTILFHSPDNAVPRKRTNRYN